MSASRHTRGRATSPRRPAAAEPAKNRRGAGGRFTPGTSGNPNGRKAGTPNKATIEVREVCAAIVDDPAYVQKVKARALAGELPPAVETMLWYYRFGKPVERHHVALGDVDAFGALEAAVAEANGE